MAFASLAVAASFVFMGDLQRFVFIGRLCSDHKAYQTQSINFIVRRIEDPSVVRAADRKIDRIEEACFERVAEALSAADVWGPRFERSWVRYLTSRVAKVDTARRSFIAVELARLCWHRKPFHDDPRIPEAIRTLLRDADPSVRLNALSAAASLVGPQRQELVTAALDDPHPQIAWHASLMRALLEGWIESPEEDPTPSGLHPQLKLLFDLERTPSASRPLEIHPDWPPLLRLTAVRASSSSTPKDLLPVFESPESALRDLGCVIALERFTPAECRDLARELIGSFDDAQRRAGALLAAMSPGTGDDPELMDRVRYRAARGDDWHLKQHFLLALWMLGEPPDNFRPEALLVRSDVPKSSLVMAMLHMGRLEGLDLLLSPFGDPSGGLDALRTMLGYSRYAAVLRRYLPQIPPLPYWSDEETQKQELDLMRNWYLLFRPELKFDTLSRQFERNGVPMISPGLNR